MKLKISHRTNVRYLESLLEITKFAFTPVPEWAARKGLSPDSICLVTKKTNGTPFRSLLVEVKVDATGLYIYNQHWFIVENIQFRDIGNDVPAFIMSHFNSISCIDYGVQLPCALSLCIDSITEIVNQELPSYMRMGSFDVIRLTKGPCDFSASKVVEYDKNDTITRMCVGVLISGREVENTLSNIQVRTMLFETEQPENIHLNTVRVIQRIREEVAKGRDEFLRIGNKRGFSACF